ncbi:amidohydrolase family protein [Bisporella sp. PMI_857]|nr:amidohydrolase family protein [Bisporella sp. PMI_857]
MWYSLMSDYVAVRRYNIICLGSIPYRPREYFLRLTTCKSLHVRQPDILHFTPPVKSYKMHLSQLLVLANSVGTALSASILLSGGTIIAFDEELESLNVIRNGALLVTDDRIAGLYDVPKPQGLPKDIEIVDCTHKIISPGFVDTHRHGWQTAMKTMGSNTTLTDYLFRFAAPASAVFYTAEDVYIGQLAGLLEALNAGVTTNLDHAHHTWDKERSEAGLDATIESGARVFWAHNFGSVGKYLVPDQITAFRKWLKTKPKPDGLTTISVAYDSWSFEPAAHTQAVVNLIKELKPAVLTTHWLGGVWPIVNSPETLQPYGILELDTAIVFSHAVAVSAGTASLLRATNHFISITPESEMHYGHSHFGSHLIQDQASLGVDTFLTFSTDLITQARIWLQRTRSRLYDEVINRWQIPASNPMSVNQAFLLATRQGGLALRRPDLGVIRVGAKADLVVFNGRSPSMLGWLDPVAAVILHSNVGDIEHVLVDGKFKKREGKLTYENYDAVVDRLLASAERLQAIISEQPAPVYDGTFYGVPCTYGHPLEVDAQHGPGNGYGELFWKTTSKTQDNTGKGGKDHNEL